MDPNTIETLTAAEPNPTDNYKAGDKVRILAFPTGAFIGESGIVTRVDPKLPCPIGVAFGPRYSIGPFFFQPYELELVTRQEPQP